MTTACLTLLVRDSNNRIMRIEMFEICVCCLRLYGCCVLVLNSYKKTPTPHSDYQSPYKDDVTVAQFLFYCALLLLNLSTLNTNKLYLSSEALKNTPLKY